MSRVDEIEQAILALTAQEFSEIVQRIQELAQDRWDAQMDVDAAAGRLDFLRQEAIAEGGQGLLLDWPPAS